jgi:hypothetical protein
MEMRSRLFEMMKSGDASQPGYPWFMVGVASRGTAPADAAVPKGWIAVAGFAIVLAPAMSLIWGWGFASGVYSVAFAAVATILVIMIAIAGAIRLGCSRMIEQPPSGDQPR